MGAKNGLTKILNVVSPLTIPFSGKLDKLFGGSDKPASATQVDSSAIDRVASPTQTVFAGNQSSYLDEDTTSGRKKLLGA